MGALDQIKSGNNVGCPALMNKVLKLKPKLHIFGHIHYSYGSVEKQGIKFGNVALCNEEYDPINPIQVFDV